MIPSKNTILSANLKIESQPSKNYKLHIQSARTMDLVKILGKYGIKFEVGDEYVDYLDANRTWYRDFTVRVTKRMKRKIRKEFHENTKVKR